MHSFDQLLALVGPRPLAAAEMSRARRLFLAAFAFVSALGLSALWGVAAGSHDGRFALENAASVPLLLLMSSVASLPLGLLVFRLTVAEGRASDLVLGHAGAVFGGSLVLAFLTPIVALYQYSSSWAGPIVAHASAFLGIATGLALLLRSLAKLVPEARARRGMLAPVGLLCLAQGAALMQLSAIAPPVMPHRTVLGRGIDGIAHAGASNAGPSPATPGAEP
jgi:hypothetical protein